MKELNVQDFIETALEIGIDTTGQTKRGTERMDGFKTVSSDEVEAVRAALKQCDENAKSVILDTLSSETRGNGMNYYQLDAKRTQAHEIENGFIFGMRGANQVCWMKLWYMWE